MRLASERGAVLVQVALAMTAVCGFCALAVDTGVLWVARAQAQTAADAAALAAAVTIGFDTNDDFFADVPRHAALAVAGQHQIWTQPVLPAASAGQQGISVSFDVPSCVPPGALNPNHPGLNCVKVDVVRNQLPTYFAHAFGVTSQAVRASALATAVPANSSRCVWPVAIPDRWQEPESSGIDWTPDPPSPSTFVKASGDLYVRPSLSSPGTGFSINIQGTLSSSPQYELTLTQADFGTPIKAGQYVPIVASTLSFAQAIHGCNGIRMTIGDTLSPDTSNTIAQLTGEAKLRRDRDPLAVWEDTDYGPRVRHSCAASAPQCETTSPRIVVLPVFDVNMYEATRATGAPTIKVVNFVGLFISSATDTEIKGQLTIHHGELVTDREQVGTVSSFLWAVVLYR
jgi:hypothetical protein